MQSLLYGCVPAYPSTKSLDSRGDDPRTVGTIYAHIIGEGPRLAIAEAAQIEGRAPERSDTSVRRIDGSSESSPDQDFYGGDEGI